MIADDPDDRSRRKACEQLSVPGPDLLANRVFARKVFLGQRFIYDGDGLAFFGVGISEGPAALDRDAHGFDVTRACDKIPDVRKIGRVRNGFGILASQSLEPAGCAAEWQKLNESGVLHTGDLADFAGNALSQALELFGAGVTSPGSGKGQGQAMIRFEPGIDVSHPDECLDQQAGAGKRNDREGQLSNKQPAAQAATHAAGSDGRATRCQRRPEIEARSSDGREEPGK